jgi:nucleotide-binding universal stress UspA family protein
MSVVVAYTPDAYGEAALSHGAAEAKHRSTGLVVVNATKGDAFVDTKYANADEMEVMLNGLAESGLDVTVRRDVTADIAHLVVDVAKETEASLVVVGIRHRSPVGKALMGSVAQRIVLDAPCPVLAVKPAR